ncbi:MAG: TIGR00270 family protein [Candidatus Lokiarchaeota archaeon]|nr:TIGR00270 family protein [Candidatus Lokiarchaeota archaeon]MBD3198884.1 TIGR00270 family protein [Candidatus Lokiarchaeota archaeon]
MPKRNRSEFDKECPICGGLIWSGGEKVLIEGAKITVCQSCASHGKKIISRPKSKSRYKRSNAGSKSYPKKSSSPKTYSKKYTSPNKVIIENYAEKIRKVRERRGLTQEKFAQRLHEKESLIRRIESAKTKPTLQLAKKIEKTYKIKLIEEADITEVKTDRYMKRKGGTSLGDIAFIKKKKED